MALVELACCTAAHGSMEDVPENTATIHVTSQPALAASANGETARHIGDSTPQLEGRPLGTLGVFYLILTALGAIAIAVAGYLLVSARSRRRDGLYVLLCVVGFALLVTAAFGLVLLNR